MEIFGSLIVEVIMIEKNQPIFFSFWNLIERLKHSNLLGQKYERGLRQSEH